MANTQTHTHTHLFSGCPFTHPTPSPVQLCPFLRLCPRGGPRDRLLTLRLSSFAQLCCKLMENRKTALTQDASARTPETVVPLQSSALTRPSTWIWLLPLCLRSPGASSSAALCSTECHSPSEPLPCVVLTISPPFAAFCSSLCEQAFFRRPPSARAERRRCKQPMM